jgi:hypothetical protein
MSLPLKVLVLGMDRQCVLDREALEEIFEFLWREPYCVNILFSKKEGCYA